MWSLGYHSINSQNRGNGTWALSFGSKQRATCFVEGRRNLIIITVPGPHPPSTIAEDDRLIFRHTVWDARDKLSAGGNACGFGWFTIYNHCRIYGLSSPQSQHSPTTTVRVYKNSARAVCGQHILADTDGAAWGALTQYWMVKTAASSGQNWEHRERSSCRRIRMKNKRPLRT